MIVPNAENAIVDMQKLRAYCLDPQHKIGRYKARVFASALDLTEKNAEELAEALLVAVRNKDAKIGRSDKFGQRYTVDFTFERGEKKTTVRSVWIIEADTAFPRLITCFVL